MVQRGMHSVGGGRHDIAVVELSHHKCSSPEKGCLWLSCRCCSCFSMSSMRMKNRCFSPAALGLIPADGDVWKTRRRVVVPSLHRLYIANMIGMFGDCAMHGVATLQQAQQVCFLRLSSAAASLVSSCGEPLHACVVLMDV